MTLNCEALPTRSHQEFCVALKSARERKGISLARIAEATKIPASLFAALERNDLRYWPKGLYRRSFFRDYVRMLGLPEAEVCAEFDRLFGDDEGAKSASAAVEGTPAGDLRLILDADWHQPRESAAARLVAAVVDAASVAVVAIVIAWAAGAERGTTAAIVAVTYFSLATMLLGSSPAKWVGARRQPIVEAMTRGAAAVSAAFRRGGAALPVEKPAPTTWITDARRVGPPAQLRFRIKESS